MRRFAVIYANIDKPFIDIEMWGKLGSYTGGPLRARLPVVELDGEMMQRPDHDVLIARIYDTQP